MMRGVNANSLVAGWLRSGDKDKNTAGKRLELLKADLRAVLFAH